jgi:Pyruvate/2-oxoacid:ferredoxin oxidoreductase delta subunit
MNELAKNTQSEKEPIKAPYAYKHKTKGLGISNFIKNVTAVRPVTWKAMKNVFGLIVTASKLSKISVLGSVIKFGMMIAPERKKFSRGVILNLNIDLTDASKNVVMPIDIMKQAVTESSFRAVLTHCICRDLHDCQNFPHDLGCIFTGEGARGIVERKVGREITVKEALDHIDRAASLGLIGQSLWIEVEQFFWGINSEDMHRFLEFCFCCPCCCTALKIVKNSGPDVRSRFRSVGWKARIDRHTCTDCGICATSCPIEAIKETSEGTTIDEAKCLGCGICASRCQQSSITLHLIDAKNLKADIKDHFSEIGLDLGA